VWNTAIEETYWIRSGVTLALFCVKYKYKEWRDITSALITASKETDRVRYVMLFPRFFGARNTEMEETYCIGRNVTLALIFVYHKNWRSILD